MGRSGDTNTRSGGGGGGSVASGGWNGSSSSSSTSSSSTTGPASTSSSTSSFVGAALAGLFVGFTAATATSLGYLAYLFHKKSLEKLERIWQEKRLSERRGRINAEIQLRQALKREERYRRGRHQVGRKNKLRGGAVNHGSITKGHDGAEGDDTTTSGVMPAIQEVDDEDGSSSLEQQQRDGKTKDEEEDCENNDGEDDGVVGKRSANAEGEDEDEDDDDEEDEDMILRCIGILRTPFPKRMGTPRQGSLAPHTVGYVQFQHRPNNKAVCPPECIDGLEQYSHCWIIFSFHANTDLITSTKTKIRPPRAPRGMGKIGMLATRSPHRPNPLGLSLVKVERWDKSNKRLYLSALDLVDGTPVYDIKPCVPWDIPGYHEYMTTSDNDDDNERRSAVVDSAAADVCGVGGGSCGGNGGGGGDRIQLLNRLGLKVPTWVSAEDAIQNVRFTPDACIALEGLWRKKRLEPYYSPPPPPSSSTTAAHRESNAKNTVEGNGGDDESSSADGLTSSLVRAKIAIEEVLSQDPRASKQRGQRRRRDNNNGKNLVGTQSTEKVLDHQQGDEPYRVVFGKVEVHFVVVACDTKAATTVVRMTTGSTTNGSTRRKNSNGSRCEEEEDGTGSASSAATNASEVVVVRVVDVGDALDGAVRVDGGLPLAPGGLMG